MKKARQTAALLRKRIEVLSAQYEKDIVKINDQAERIAELVRVRLAVLEEVENKIESIDFYSYVHNATFSAGVDRMKEAMLDAIKSMKEAAK